MQLAMYREGTHKLTENGALPMIPLHRALLDLFSQIGALRPRTRMKSSKFAAAFREDKLLASQDAVLAGDIPPGWSG